MIFTIILEALMSDIQQQLRQEVGSWQGVSIVPHRFGGIEFQVNGREFGHLITL